jgi:hypothetical protein
MEIKRKKVEQERVELTTLIMALEIIQGTLNEQLQLMNYLVKRKKFEEEKEYIDYTLLNLRATKMLAGEQKKQMKNRIKRIDTLLK